MPNTMLVMNWRHYTRGTPLIASSVTRAHVVWARRTLISRKQMFLQLIGTIHSESSLKIKSMQSCMQHSRFLVHFGMSRAKKYVLLHYTEHWRNDIRFSYVKLYWVHDAVYTLVCKFQYALFIPCLRVSFVLVGYVPAVTNSTNCSRCRRNITKELMAWSKQRTLVKYAVDELASAGIPRRLRDHQSGQSTSIVSYIGRFVLEPRSER